jgi:hypothetical protein
MTFKEALPRFQALLEERGWPPRILWARPHDVARGADGGVTVFLATDAEDATDAARAYEREHGAGRAPTLVAVCTLGDATCATVTSGDAAEPRLSVPAARVAGVARWPVC